ncbi:MAG TPA: SBBP repeat-containing protein [Myxococcaceae bacterium]|nr:SBBP repeat-containing protein [Myxococcaceae bacterium]
MGKDGAAYVTGALIPPTRSFDGTALTSAGALDVFVGRYWPTGHAAWVRRVGDLGIQDPTGLAVTRGGTVAVAGHFTGRIQADSVSLTSPDSQGADFLLGFAASDGQLRWGHAFADGAEGALSSVAASTDQDRIAVCGHATQAATGLVPEATFQGDRDAIVALFDGSGRRIWSRQLGGAGDEDCAAVAVDASGDVYAAGAYNRAFTLATPLPETAGADNEWIWVAKLDGRTGAVVSQAAFGGPTAAQRPTSLAVDRDGAVVLGGMMNGALEFGGQSRPLVSAGYVDGFVARLDARATPPFQARWAVRLGGPSVDGTRSVAFDPFGDVIAAGFYSVRTTGAAALSGEPPGTDAFLLVLDGTTGATRSALRFGDRDTQTADRVATGQGPDGRPYLVLGGELTGTIELGSLPALRGGPAGATYLIFAR